MTLLKWKSSYTLGIPSVDHEHRELIEMINQTYELIGAASGPDAIAACLEEIHTGISAHFALEERHMREARYEEYAEHKDDHEDLLDQIRDIMDEFLDHPDSGMDSLEAGLADWFGKHFSTFDARLHLKLGDHHG